MHLGTDRVRPHSCMRAASVGFFRERMPERQNKFVWISPVPLRRRSRLR
jgi:hypothetical protein